MVTKGPEVSEVIKILDENVFGKIFIIDDKSWLAHHVVSPDFCVLEVSSSERLVSLEEGHLSHHGLLGVLAAEGEGGFSIRNPSLLKFIPAASNPAVHIEEEEREKREDLNP